MPEVWTVWNWRETKPEFSKLIQRAREAQSESMLDDCQALADDAARVALDPECGSASVAAKKLAIETRLKVDPEQLAQLQEDEKTALETIVGKLHP